jgi:uncharacterized protein (TIGR04222 family)
VVESYLVICGLMLVTAVLARALPVTRHSFDDDHEDGWDLSPREVAYLRGGPHGVVLAVLAELHGEGAVDLTRGRVRRLDPPRDLHDALTVAVYSGLRWTRWPRLLALLPRVRRACRPLRWDLLERRLLVPGRRKVLSVALRLYALGLAAAMVVEDDYRGSTMLAAVAVGAVAVFARGPRRTVAGLRELRLHRAALRRVADDGPTDRWYLADIVAAHGRPAILVLCGDVVRSGDLAAPAPTYEPAPVPAPAGTPSRRPEPARIGVVIPLRVPRQQPHFEVFVPVEAPPQVESAVLRQRVPVAA